MFNSMIPGITTAATGLFALVASLSLLAAGATGIQMIIDMVTGNVLAQRQHKGQIVKVLGIAFLFGSAAAATTIINSVVAGMGG